MQNKQIRKMPRISKGLLRPTFLAGVVTFVGWAAFHLLPQRDSWHWITYPGALLAMPGFFIATVVAAIFSPQGFHGGSDFSWLISPTNFVAAAEETLEFADKCD